MNKQSKKSKKIEKQPEPTRPNSVVGKIWSILIAVITLAGAWILVRPVIHVEPYTRLNPTSPFSERFKVSNDGNFAIHDVYSGCLILEARMTDGKEIHDSVLLDNPYTRTLDAAQSTTIDCDVQRTISFGNAQFTAAEIELTIAFKPPWYYGEKRNSFRFSGQLDSQGNVEWVYSPSPIKMLPKAR